MLFDYLVKRLGDSFDIPAGVATYQALMIRRGGGGSLRRTSGIHTKKAASSIELLERYPRMYPVRRRGLMRGYRYFAAGGIFS